MAAAPPVGQFRLRRGAAPRCKAMMGEGKASMTKSQAI
jgi:hypothetical protein